MAQTFTDVLTHAVFAIKRFLRPCGASGVVCGYPYPGLTALGYYPVPRWGAKVSGTASPARGIA